MNRQKQREREERCRTKRDKGRKTTKNVKSETEVCTDVREYACIKSHGRTSRKRSRKSKKKEIQSHVYKKKAEE